MPLLEVETLSCSFGGLRAARALERMLEVR